MIKKFILNLAFVKKEIASAHKTVEDLEYTTKALQWEQREFREYVDMSEKKVRELNTQIQNYQAGALKLQQEHTEHLKIISTLKMKATGLEEMIKEQEKIINEPSDNAQVNNLKKKIKELQSEVEIQKQITFKKNQELNKVLGQ